MLIVSMFVCCFVCVGGWGREDEKLRNHTAHYYVCVCTFGTEGGGMGARGCTAYSWYISEIFWHIEGL